MVYDPNLGQEVLKYDKPLRKQIFVDPGITVSRFTADDEVVNRGGVTGPGSKKNIFMTKA